MTVTLRPFTPDDEAQARRAHAELLDDGFDFLLGRQGESWAEHLTRSAREARGEGLAPGRVRGELLAVDVDGALAGRVSIRYALNDWLRAVGGHVGYAVRPAWRGQGVATAALRLSLVRLQEAGVECALLTCDPTNVASATVIERCGGLYEGTVPDEDGTKRRYWVPTVAMRGASTSA